MTIHCSALCPMPRSCWIEDSATFTIAMSSTTMNWAAHASRRIIPLPVRASPGTDSVIEAPHRQVDGGPGHPARLVGGHDDRQVCHLLERHQPSRMGLAGEELLPLLPGHARGLGAGLVGVLDRRSLRHGVRAETDHANARGGELGREAPGE